MRVSRDSWIPPLKSTLGQREREREGDWTGRGGTSRSSIMPQEEHAIVISSLGQIMDAAGPCLPHKVSKG